MASEQNSREYTLRNPEHIANFPATSIQEVLEAMFSDSFMKNGSVLFLGKALRMETILATFMHEAWELDENYFDKSNDGVFIELTNIFPKKTQDFPPTELTSSFENTSSHSLDVSDSHCYPSSSSDTASSNSLALVGSSSIASEEASYGVLSDTENEALKELETLSEQYDLLKPIFFHQSFWRAGQRRVSAQIDQLSEKQTPLSKVLNSLLPPNEIKRIANLLFAAGASIEHVQNRENSLLNAAACGYTSIVRQLLAAGANKEAAAQSGGTPLYAAARNGHREVVELLLHAGANIEAATHEGITPLHAAACNGHLEVIELLLSAGANIEAATHEGTTPLRAAAYKGHREVVELLLRARANIEAATPKGATPLYAAARNGHREIVELLLGAGANIEAATHEGSTSLRTAAYNGHREVVELLLRARANIEAATPKGATSLRAAAHNGHREVVALLLSAGANIEAATQYGKTPLHAAAYKGHREIVALLLSAGANIEAATQYGETPLHSATDKGHREVVELLLSAGANTEAATQYGETPLHCATDKDYREVVELLLSAGANKEAPDQNGRTPLYYAAYKSHREVVRVLLGAEASEENIGECLRIAFQKSSLGYASSSNQRILSLLIAHQDSTQPLPTPSSSSMPEPTTEFIRRIRQIFSQKFNRELFPDFYDTFDRKLSEFLTYPAIQEVASSNFCLQALFEWSIQRIEVYSQYSATPHDLLDCLMRQYPSGNRIQEPTSSTAPRSSMTETSVTPRPVTPLSTPAFFQPTANSSSETPVQPSSTNINELFLCPITQEVMRDPVMAADSHTYERSAIVAWFEKHDRSPITNLVLENKTLLPNIILRNLMEQANIPSAPLPQTLPTTSEEQETPSAPEYDAFLYDASCQPHPFTPSI